MNLRHLLACLCVLLLITAPVGGQTPTAAQNAILEGVGIDQHLNTSLPLDAVFRDETNSTLHLSDLLHGKPVVLVLVQYRCPSLCTAILNDMLSTLKVVPQNAGSDYDVWAVSFDPKEDATLAAAKKGEYLRSYQRARPDAPEASAGWHFLTGDAANIGRLTQAVGFRYKWDDASQQFIHPAAIVLITPEGKISRYFYGVDYDPTDLRLSLVEASHGKIGTLTDQILLFCYHYDPATGRYSLAVLNALKVGGALTILLLGAVTFLLWRADVRRTRLLLARIAQSAPRQAGGTAP